MINGVTERKLNLQMTRFELDSVTSTMQSHIFSLKLLLNYKEKTWPFFDFSTWRSSTILDFTPVRTIHKGHLVVFVSLQNLVGIGAVVSIITMF